jgi:hypothetical protein
LPALHRAGPGRPSHVDIPSRVDIISSQGLMPLEGFAWHGCPRLPALHRADPERPSHADIPSRVAFVWSRGSCRSRVSRGMGARGCLLYIVQVPGDLLTSISHRGLTSFRAKGSCRSKVLRGMGARGCLLYIEQIPGDLLTLISHRGSLLSGAEGHAARGFHVAWVPAVACSTSSRFRTTFSRCHPTEGRLGFEPGVRPARGFSLLGKGPGHLSALRSWPRFRSAGASF